MDAAKMIEEKRLRQGFMLATLISTIAGTFITSINLYDRLVEQRRQKKLDRGQNKKIKELEQRLNEEQDEKRRIKEAHRKKHDDSDDDDSDTSSSSNNNRKKKRRNNGGNNGLRNSLEQSGNIVQQTYDRYLANLGPRFAQGDLIAQTQVQSQIILLQGSVIKLLEEALLTGTMPDINRLYNTSEFAREGSMRALRDQYQRMLEAATPQPGRRPPGLVRKISSTPSLRDRPDDSAWRHRRPEPKALVYDKRSDRLFCPCAEELQRTNRPLDSCIVMDRSSAALCEACGAEVDAGNDAGSPGGWRIEKEVVLRSGSSVGRGRRWSSRESDDGSETTVLRSYLVTRRFIFKCHREGSEFACYLCCCYRDRDTLCRSEESLVSHIASKHGIADYERERDIREQERALPYR